MYRLPSFVSIVEVTADRATEREFVVTNEATGQHFSADLTTVEFLEALRRSGSVEAAATEARILKPHADALVAQLQSQGIVGDGSPVEATKRKAPVEGKLISFRLDLFDASGVARRLEWLGRAMYSVPGLAVWAVVTVAALLALFNNGDKVAASLSLVRDYGAADFAAFLALYVGIKLIHELGHVLAYRMFLRRAGFHPGPIRTGIMVFAATPFPFTDVTGAWRLKSRWARAAVGAGGIYFEVFVVALLTLFWAQTSAGAFHALILQVAVFSGAMTLLFNLNPAVKLDGYYILTDIFRQPNLVGRASHAARGWVTRRLGGKAPAPGSGALAYWAISYLYRWTIFLGVFWIAYRFDPRLAPLVLAVTLLLLVARPVIATMKFAQAHGARPLRLLGSVAVAGLCVAACFVPLPARLLLDGQMLTYRTEYVFPPETARLIDTDGLRFDQPDVSQARLDLALRQEILINLNRAVVRSAPEKAALAQDLANMGRLMDELDARVASFDIHVPNGATWTPLAAETTVDAWIQPDPTRPVGAISHVAEPFFRLTLPQGRIDRGIDSDRPIRVRFTSAPDCTMDAVLSREVGDSVAGGGTLTLEATPQTAPACATGLRSGAGVVARVPLPPKSIADGTRTLVSRLLQNRLPIETEHSS